jgi:predicted TIM-barrel fold metal-dependent hydrolase
MFAWYREAMRRCHFTELIRPVHPEYCVRDASPETAQEERAFTHTVLRIDPFLDLWPRECPRRTVLAEIAGVTPVDAATWRAFLAKTFEIAAQKGCVGIKQLQAYTRTLEFIPREDGDVVWTGALSPIEVRAFQDWVVHECCRLANERGWPHQIHVGTHNLAESSPLPLGALAARYPRMKIVMLHCWPFLKESGWLAKQHPNVYLDTCWQPILSPDIYQEAMREWLPYVPRHKIMCGHDATSIEMAAGSASFVRELLAEALAEQAQLSNLPLAHIERAAADILHNNAVAVYAIGKSL